MGNGAKRGLLIFLLLVLVFPMLQQSLAFFESGKLNGAIVPSPDPTLSPDSWWDGSYQAKKTIYLNENMGCRPDLVRANNEIDFLLFEKLHANGVVLGKDGFLFEEGYIKEYCGQDFIGKKMLREEAMKLRSLQDTIEHSGKVFVFIFAPSKAYFFSDKFPADYRRLPRASHTNYRVLKQMFDSLGINYIDYNAWFVSLKNTSKDQLFTSLGTHWTIYGSLIAGDSLVRYIARRLKCDLPEPRWTEVEHTVVPRSSDDDLASGLNLIWQQNKEIFSYPKVSYAAEHRKKPAAIYIGDSFFWMWFGNNLMDHISDDWEFWYYFNERWDKNVASGKASLTYIDKSDWRPVLFGADYVVMEFNPGNLKGMNYGGSAIKRMYERIFPPEPAHP